MTHTITILTAARNIIADPDMWYQGGDWTASGKWNTSEPCCAECAIKRAAHALGVHPFDAIKHTWGFTPNHGGLDKFNDRPATTHADVLAVFDRAIASLEDKP